MISVVMPAYNEEKILRSTLAALFAQTGEFEVILVDGGSSDRTCEIARGFPQVRVRTASKGRASQMNAGARTATGEWLLFLHADTVLPVGALQRLNDMEHDPTIQAGGFMHQFSGDDWRLRFISLLDNFRCTRSRIIYGDQALFVRRSLFNQLGGFPDQAILEDVAFCERLIKKTSPLILTRRYGRPQIRADGCLQKFCSCPLDYPPCRISTTDTSSRFFPRHPIAG